jgi:hypothetical protein
MSHALSTILAVSDHLAGAGGSAKEAVEEHEKSKTPFFVAGVILVSFAIIVSVVGYKRPDFPGTPGAARGVMALSVALVAAAAFSIVYVST